MTGTDVGGRRVVAGAAGRSLCQAIATVPGYGEVLMPWSFHHFSRRPEPTPTQLLDELEQVVATGNYRRFINEADPCRLVRALESATNPWTRPEISSAELVEREAQILLPVAEALGATPATRWWTSPCDRADQHLVDITPEPPHDRPPSEDPKTALTAGLNDEADAERRLRQCDPVGFPPPSHGGGRDWLFWSSPWTPWKTSRSVTGHPPLPALGLIWTEEGNVHAQHWSVKVVDRGARIYEIDSIAAWAALVARYPRDVPYTRRSSWWPDTSWDGTWLLPEWATVSADYDAAHLTVIGFLEATGTVVPIGDARTTLVYWQPDETYWLNNVITAQNARLSVAMAGLARRSRRNRLRRRRQHHYPNRRRTSLTG
jgi:hypothetical protein